MLRVLLVLHFPLCFYIPHCTSPTNQPLIVWAQWTMNNKLDHTGSREKLEDTEPRAKLDHTGHREKLDDTKPREKLDDSRPRSWVKKQWKCLFQP